MEFFINLSITRTCGRTIRETREDGRWAGRKCFAGQIVHNWEALLFWPPLGLMIEIINEQLTLQPPPPGCSSGNAGRMAKCNKIPKRIAPLIPHTLVQIDSSWKHGNNGMPKIIINHPTDSFEYCGFFRLLRNVWFRNSTTSITMSLLFILLLLLRLPTRIMPPTQLQ